MIQTAAAISSSSCLRAAVATAFFRCCFKPSRSFSAACSEHYADLPSLRSRQKAQKRECFLHSRFCGKYVTVRRGSTRSLRSRSQSHASHRYRRVDFAHILKERTIPRKSRSKSEPVPPIGKNEYKVVFSPSRRRTKYKNAFFSRTTDKTQKRLVRPDNGQNAIQKKRIPAVL